MTKVAKVTTALPADAPQGDAPSAAPKKPFSIQLIGPSYLILQELCAHVRNGYVINRDAPFDFFGTGHIMFNLVLGSPDEQAIAQAKEPVAHSVEVEAAQYRRDVDAAAKSMMEQERREALEKEVAAAVAASEKAIAKLRQDAQAELARLTK